MIKKLITASTIASLAVGGIATVFGQDTIEYQLSVSPVSIALEPGGAAQTVTVTARSTGGFSEEVTLSFSDLPTYLKATRFEPNPILVPADGTADSSVSISAAAGAPTGVISLKILGESGSGMLREVLLSVEILNGTVSLTVVDSNMQLNTTPADGTNDRLANVLTAAAPSGSISQVNLVDVAVTLAYAIDISGHFYRFDLSPGGLECAANASGGQDCAINQAGRDSSGLQSGSFTVSTSFGSAADTVTLKLNDPKISLPIQNYSLVTSDVKIQNFVVTYLLSLGPNSNETVWKTAQQ